mgnify:CR=1 FL=1
MTETRPRYGSALEDEFALQLRAANIEFEREYRAAPGRKYRWDFLISGLLVEIQGGTWTKSGHTTGSGIERDLRKMNLATLHGYAVMAGTADMVHSGELFESVREWLDIKRSFDDVRDEIEIQSDMQEEDE